MRPAILACLTLLLSGCLKNHNTFRSWWWNGGQYDSMTVPEERSKAFLGLRTVELVLQPSGGLTTPTLAYTATNPGGWYPTARYDVIGDGRGPRVERQEYALGDSSDHASTRGTYDRRFITHNGGILDLIPYRVWTAKAMLPDEKIGRSFLQPLMVAVFYPFLAIRRVPSYVAIDVYKTLMLPVAAVYYHRRPEK
ncbi:MAG: hypothetical protein HYZ75_02605 [Elusimicrobia bacterium]|nr:hypothetical protein [Elusimicrobiota bacterium]